MNRQGKIRSHTCRGEGATRNATLAITVCWVNLAKAIGPAVPENILRRQLAARCTSGEAEGVVIVQIAWRGRAVDRSKRRSWPPLRPSTPNSGRQGRSLHRRQRDRSPSVPCRRVAATRRPATRFSPHRTGEHSHHARQYQTHTIGVVRPRPLFEKLPTSARTSGVMVSTGPSCSTAGHAYRFRGAARRGSAWPGLGHISGLYAQKDPSLASLYENDDYLLNCSMMGARVRAYDPDGTNGRVAAGQ